jgi:hypothetical protein
MGKTTPNSLALVLQLFPAQITSMSSIQSHRLLGGVQTTFLKLKNWSLWVMRPKFWSRWDCWVTGARSGLDNPDLKKISSFILITKTYPGFPMDVHPGMENDDGGFPKADPSDTEDDCGDKRTALYQQQGQDVFF